MKKLTIGYIVTTDGNSLELEGNADVSLRQVQSKRSSDFYSSRLYVGSSTTVFESRRAAQRAINRTKKQVAQQQEKGIQTYFLGKRFDIERLTAFFPFSIKTNGPVTVS